MAFADWAHDTLAQMSLNQKIGQLFFIGVQSNPYQTDYEQFRQGFGLFQLVEDHDINYAKKMIDEYHVGGILFIRGGDPLVERKAIRQLQQMSPTPLLISQDAEWGLTMLLNNTIRFPKNMTLGAIQNDDLIYQMGKEIGRQCQLLGIHINLAPVVDVNNNPLNPVINNRSFGENKDYVTQKGVAFMRGLQEHVLACAKHWPGHGDVDADSHEQLPMLRHTRSRLEQVELYPFKRMINAGVQAIMPAHLHIPAFDATPKKPSSLSRTIVHDLLRDTYAFDGLIISDSLVMRGATDYCKQDGDVELNALLAGHDVLLFPKQVSLAHKKIKEAVLNGLLSIEELDEHVLRILSAKEQLGLHQQRFVQPDIIGYEDINTQRALELKKELYKNAITLVKNKSIIPLRGKKKAIALVQTTHNPVNLFAQELKNDIPIDIYSFSAQAQEADMITGLERLKQYDTIIFGIYATHYHPRLNFGIPPITVRLIHESNKQARVILVIFGNAYLLQSFGDETAIVVAYEDDPDAQIAAANVLLGKQKATGKLPVTASEKFRAGHGL